MTATDSNALGVVPTSTSPTSTSHDEVTLQLAKKESAHHFHGMAELQSIMKTKSLKVKAFAMNDQSAPSSKSTYDSNSHSNNTNDDNDNNNVNDNNVKIVHFVRHGQGFHNLLADIYTSQGKEWTQFKQEENNPYVRNELLDAPLTDKGRKQAQALQPQVEAFGNADTDGTDGSSTNNNDEVESLELVVLSTNCRALQTGVIAFQSYVNNDNVPFLAHEMIREEIGVHLCDQRRPISLQKLEFPMVNFDLVENDEDTLFTYDRRESKIEIGDRIYKFLEWLESRHEKHIGVTSHSGWLFTLFNGVIECEDELKSWFQTGEMRSVKLVFSINTPTSSNDNDTCKE